MANKEKIEFPFESKILTKTLDLSNGRFYTQRKLKDEKKRLYFPSVTTILKVIHKGDGFDRWLGNASSYNDAMAYADEAANIGSIVHALCMRLLWGEKIDTTKGFYDDKKQINHILDNRVNKRLTGFCKFIDDHDPIIVANEISLFNPRLYRKQPLYPYAGQADQVYKINDKYILCDIKTGADYPSHGLQLTAYKLIWDSLYPDHKIDEMWGLYLSDSWIKKPYRIKKYDFQPEDWLTTVDLWQWYKGHKNIKPKFKKEYDSIFELNLIYKEEDTDGI